MKQLFSILTLQLCVTVAVFGQTLGQMPGMASHSSPPADDSNMPNPAPNSSHITFTKDVAPIVQVRVLLFRC